MSSVVEEADFPSISSDRLVSVTAPGVTFFATPELEKWARYLSERHDEMAANLAEDWFIPLPDDITVVLEPGAEAMGESMNREPLRGILGLAQPAKRLIRLNFTENILRGQAAIGGTYYHELVHIGLHHDPVSGRVIRPPRWFDEGLAMYISKSWDLAETWQLDVPEPSRIVSLESVEAGFYGPRAEMQASYRRSHDIVSYFMDRHGFNGLKALLDEFRRSGNFAEAFSIATDEPLVRFEEAYRNHSEGLATTIRRLLEPSMSWVAMALLAVVAIVVASFRRRRKQAELEAEDAWEDLIAESIENDVFDIDAVFEELGPELSRQSDSDIIPAHLLRDDTYEGPTSDYEH